MSDHHLGRPNGDSAAAEPCSPEQRRAQALQRIEASRSQLILALSPQPPDRSRSASHKNSVPPSAAALTTLLSRIQRDGWVDGAWRTARSLARRWWKRQPWHGPVELAASTLAHEARPLVQRHPWAALAAAAAVGAGLMAVRPWATKTVLQRAQPWRHQLGTTLWTQLSQAPVQLALAGALTAWITELTKKSAEAKKPAPAAAASTTPAATPPP